MEEYRRIFNQRGHQYDDAMLMYPNARNAEFLSLFDGIDLTSIQTLLDVPAGTGYLQRLLPEHIVVTELDPSEGFLGRARDVRQFDEDFGVVANAFDCVTCLAALHHVHPKEPFLAQCIRALKPGGLLLIGDVKDASPEAEFLDGFAGKHNGTGHQGFYLAADEPSLQAMLGQDAKIQNVEYRPTPWQFPTRQALAEFCISLFGMSDVSASQVLAELDRTVGIIESAGTVRLNWHLLYVTARKC